MMVRSPGSGLGQARSSRLIHQLVRCTPEAANGCFGRQDLPTQVAKHDLLEAGAASCKGPRGIPSRRSILKRATSVMTD